MTSVSSNTTEELGNANTFEMVLRGSADCHHANGSKEPHRAGSHRALRPACRFFRAIDSKPEESIYESQNMFIAGRYADALAELRGLLTQLPLNTPT